MPADLVLLLEDHLTRDAASLEAAQPSDSVVVLAEVPGELDRLPWHKQRLVLVLSAMRHFRDALREDGWTVDYQALDDDHVNGSYETLLKAKIDAHQPDRVLTMRPHDYRILEELEAACQTKGVELDVREDNHFLSTPDDFAEWAEDRNTLTMEYFYRAMRKRYGVLMTEDGDPVGGSWNYDKENRESFGDDPGSIKAPIHFEPDDLTRSVMQLVADRFGDNPGTLDGFSYPVTHDEAQRAVRDFVEHRLPDFGTYQDAMWMDRPFLYHSRLSAAINLHLVDPRYVIGKAEEAYHEDQAPLNAVEGFIRQILGWREFVRGVYWLHMPDYYDLNALDARRKVPDFFWTGETEMTCVRQTVEQLLETAYAHHIQRLMVTGLFAQLYGIRPQRVHEWHLALYADAWEWVSLPNVVGMSQYGDDGIMATKPYVATGKYVNRMSNYCDHCRYDPDAATGDDACPFTTLYWDFLAEHRDKFDDNRRMNFQIKNLDKKGSDTIDAIRDRAATIRRALREGRA